MNIFQILTKWFNFGNQKNKILGGWVTGNDVVQENVDRINQASGRIGDPTTEFVLKSVCAGINRAAYFL